MSRFPKDVTAPTTFDNHAVVLAGDVINSAVPIILHASAFARLPDMTCLTSDEIVGASGHGAATPVLRTGTHSAGDPNVSPVRARKLFLFKATVAPTAFMTSPAGRHSLAGFHQTFLNAELLSGDAACVSAAKPCRDWFCLASTTNGSCNSVLATAPVASGGPIPTQKLNSWVTRIKADLKAHQGVGGPGLTSAAFNVGVAALQTVMEDNARNHLQFEQNHAQKTFTDKHSDSLATQMHRLCNVHTDATPPEIHILLAKFLKNRDCAIMQSMIHEHTEASTVPLTVVAAPLATPAILDKVFHSLCCAGTGLQFRSNLPPFAVVCEDHNCEDHKESNTLNKLIKAAVAAEGGTSLSLVDSERLLTTADIRFPTAPQTAAKKLCGWSVLVDLFHGSAHVAAITIRNFVIIVGPALHCICDQCPKNPSMAVDLVCHVLCEAQQEHFAWATATANSPAGAGPVLNLDTILAKTLTFRANSLSRTTWMLPVELHPEEMRVPSPALRPDHAHPLLARDWTSTPTWIRDC